MTGDAVASDTVATGDVVACVLSTLMTTDDLFCATTDYSMCVLASGGAGLVGCLTTFFPGCSDVTSIGQCVQNDGEPLDNTPPTAQISRPGANQTVSGTVTVQAVVQDNMEVIAATVSVRDSNGQFQTLADYAQVGGATVGDCTRSDLKDVFCSASWNTTQFPDGTATLRVTVMDRGGMTGSSDISVTIDNGATAPRPVPTGCTVRSISVGSTVTDALTPGADCDAPHRGQSKADLYRFQAAAGDRVTVAMDGVTLGDPYLYLIGPDGSLLSEDDDGGTGQNALLSDITLPNTGTYEIEATSFAFEGGQYRLSLSGAGSSPAPDSCSPTSISIGGTVTGSLSSGDCNAPNRSQSRADLYTFTGTSGQEVTIAMDGGTLTDPYLNLVGPNGSVVISNDDGGSGRNSLITDAVLTSSGTYTIEATAFAGQTGTYTLSMVATAPPPTGSCSTSGISIGGTVSGTLGDSDCAAPNRPQSRADLFTFTGAAGQEVTIAMDGGTLTDPYLFLVGPDNSVVAENDDGGTNRNALIDDVTLPSSGTYTIQATAFSGQTGSYQVSLTGTSPSTPTPTGCTLTLIGSGETLSGTLDDGDCRAPNRDGSPAELFQFQSGGGKVVTISMEGGTLSDPYLVLVAPDGSVVSEDDDSGDGFNALLSGVTLPGQTGFYTIEATSWAGENGTYTVSLTGSGLFRMLKPKTTVGDDGKPGGRRRGLKGVPALGATLDTKRPSR